MSKSGLENPAFVETIVHNSTNVNANQQTPAVHYAAPPATVRLNYFEKMQKHRPNSNSMAGGSILMMASAMHLAWGLWQIADINRSWTFGLSASMYSFVMYSWFLTAVVGSVIGAVLVNTWKKTIIYSICGGILTISGILYIALNEDYLAILFGRMLGGIAHGILYITIVSHYADNTFAELRGRAVVSIGIIINSTAVIVAIFNIFNDDYMGFSYSDLLTGILILIWSIMGLAVNYFLTNESVIFLMRRGQEDDAVQTLMKLRNESTETPTIRNELEEMRQMVNQAKIENQNIFSHGNVQPLLVVTMLKLQAFLTNNAIINLLLIVLVQLMLVGTATTSVGPVVLTTCRLLSGFVSVLAGDFVSRKRFLTPSGGISGILLAVFGIVLMFVYLEVGFLVLLVLFQIMVGFGIDPMNHVITSEAFPINKRAWSLALATSIEYVLQLIAMVVMYHLIVTPTAIYVIVLGSGILIAALALGIHVLLPETCNLSLKQCQDVHRGPNHRNTDSVNHSQGITYS